jgi:hypothetical protein
MFQTLVSPMQYWSCITQCPHEFCHVSSWFDLGHFLCSYFVHVVPARLSSHSPAGPGGNLELWLHSSVVGLPQSCPRYKYLALVRRHRQGFWRVVPARQCGLRFGCITPPGTFFSPPRRRSWPAPGFPLIQPRRSRSYYYYYSTTRGVAGWEEER